MMKKLAKLSLEQKRGLYGVLFLSPWMLGFVFLFAVPLLQSFRFSLSSLEINPIGFTLDFIGFENYNTALLVHSEFNRTLTEAVLNTVINVPLIVIFSLFTASLLNQKFWGRDIARTIFFLPVILASGIVGLVVSGDIMSQMLSSTADPDNSASNLLQSFELQRLMLEAGVHPAIVDYLSSAVDRIYDIVSDSGVQILIFLAGLQSVSPQLYEASKIEGATDYESFWKITFPMVSPLILVNVIYTIIDSFTDNDITAMIRATAFQSFNFGLSAAMSWVYFAAIAIVLIVMGGIISRRVFYYD